MKNKLQKICQFLEHGLVEREIPARLSLLAALSGEHLLLLGPSGTAKSELARKLQNEGVLSEHLPSYDVEFKNPEKTGKPYVDSSGSIIIALDSSASMKGNPENTAKAIVLETMRVAVREARPCLLLTFSGTDQIHKYELANTEQGWQAVLDVVSLSFHGGTDVSTVVKQVCTIIKN